MNEKFGGDKKVGKSLLHAPEQWALKRMLPHVPTWLRSHHLTLLSIPISLLIILFSWLAAGEMAWLWGASVMIFLQWVTDGLDGAVGRARNEGLVKWGYYMDHLLDYFFLAAILVGYMLLLPDASKWLHFFVLVIFGGFMVNSFLAMAATNKFQIAFLRLGPTEVRIAFIVINTLLIVFGKTYMAPALPYILGASFLGLIVVVYRTQRAIWGMDMAAKG
jgi:archaetidylinositol phosphate synthase